jgi:hypothetical protein
LEQKYFNKLLKRMKTTHNLQCTAFKSQVSAATGALFSWYANYGTVLFLSAIFFSFHWYYIPGWDLTSSLSFCHFSLDWTLILQFLHPTCATFPNSTHYLIFGLPLLLFSFPPGLAQRTMLTHLAINGEVRYVFH